MNEMSVCVCVCVCERERVRGKKKDSSLFQCRTKKKKKNLQTSSNLFQILDILGIQCVTSSEVFQRFLYISFFFTNIPLESRM